MAIVIPSKSIYKKQNSKIRNNYIDVVNVNSTNAYLLMENETSVYNSEVYFSSDQVSSKEDEQREGTYELGSSANDYRVGYAYIYSKVYYYKGNISVPIWIDNYKIDYLDEEGTSFSVEGETEKYNATGTPELDVNNEEVYLPENAQNNFVIEEKPSEKYLGTLQFPKLPTVVEAISTNVIPNKTYASVQGLSSEQSVKISVGDSTIDIEFNILVGYEQIALKGVENILNYPSNKTIIITGTKEIYNGNKIIFDIKGTKIVLQLDEKNKSFGNRNGVYPFSVDNNELLQNSNYYKQDNGTNLPSLQLNYERTLNQYKNGKETATLLCQIGEYKTESEELAISTKEEGLPMTFREGDVVIPMVMSTNGQDVPMSKYNDGTKKKFEVVKVKYIDEGCVWQEITLQEYMR